MGFWSTLLKSAGKAVGETGKSVGRAVLRPSQTLRGAGSALKTAAVGAAAGYVGWEKLTTDKSVVRIVSDAVVGEKATDAIGNTIDSAGEKVSRLTEKAEQAIDGVNGATENISSSVSGISNFIGGIKSGNAGNMFGSFLSNLANGRVSGLSIVGLIAGAFMVFGRFGWLGKIAGALLAMTMIGNNAGLLNETSVTESNRQTRTQEETQSLGGGMRR
ncbi:MAG: hypothetical protein LUC24_04835 [Bacteroidales bacterium]|nr:hypothetical protein [Bacteroidales bacterium]